MRQAQSWLSYLNDSHLVANLQRSFGIEITPVVTTSSNDVNQEQDNNHRTNTSENELRKRQTQPKNYVLTHDDSNKQIAYTINNYFFYYFFQFMTTMGNEIFYILFLPIMHWNFDDTLMYLVCQAWALSMFSGQASKDLIKSPRPTTPPVVKLEPQYLLEYGFPSTHAMAAFSISYTFLSLFFSTQTAANMSSSGIAIILATVALICFLVCLSRIYLGMHSYLDILGGIVFSLSLSHLFLRVAPHFAQLVVNYGYVAGLAIYVGYFLICTQYPSLARWSTARSDTFLIMGACSGLCLGMSLKHTFGLVNLGKLSSFLENRELERGDWLMIVARSLAGLFAVFLVRAVSKEVLYRLIRRFYKLTTACDNRQVKEFIKTNFYAELVFYYVTYSNVSFTVTFLSFFIFDHFKLT